MEKNDFAGIRRWFGLSLIQMGAKIGAHFTVVSMIEHGHRDPTEAQAKKLVSLRARMLREMREKLNAAE